MDLSTGEKIRAARLARGVTIKRMRELTGIGSEALRKLERYRMYEPTSHAIEAISKAFEEIDEKHGGWVGGKRSEWYRRKTENLKGG
jgi:transcriptional regulator with XRE-family HTH domain